MRRTLFASIALALATTMAAPASAHQPVFLLPTDTTPNAGPLLVDGTVSFAIRATFTKSGQKQAFRAALKEGDELAVQYLIVDKKPENTLKTTLLPQLVITSPSGKKITIKINERTKFYEPYGRTNYLYLARYNAPAESGVYQFVATSRARASITIAVGEKEIRGDVLRGPAPTSAASSAPMMQPTPTPAVVAPTPTPSPTPESEMTTQAGYTIAKVKENRSSASCWSVINGNVYDLTKWIYQHPGGASRIQQICGTDGSSEFNGRHTGQADAVGALKSYLLGPLAK